MALSHDPLWPRAGDWHAADDEIDFGIIGVPTFATSITPGSTNLTPAAVRAVLPRYSEAFLSGDEIHTASRLVRHDFGDVVDPDGDEPGAIRIIADAVSRTRLLVAIGGDNALTVPVAAAAWGDRVNTAGLITVDAHLDVRDGVSNGSPVRRLVEDFGVDPARVVQIAIAGSAGGPIHVDLDIDACDRSVAPACPASIPGGLSAYEMRQFARGFARDDRVRSIDLAEVDAGADSADGRTVRLTALCVLEALAGLAER